MWPLVDDAPTDLLAVRSDALRRWSSSQICPTAAFKLRSQHRYYRLSSDLGSIESERRRSPQLGHSMGNFGCLNSDANSNSAFVMGFGCRPFMRVATGAGGRRPKASREGNRGVMGTVEPRALCGFGGSGWRAGSTAIGPAAPIGTAGGLCQGAAELKRGGERGWTGADKRFGTLFRASVSTAGGQPAAKVTGIIEARGNDRDHEVSILMTATVGAGRYRGSRPRSKVSIMIIRPPQHGHG